MGLLKKRGCAHGTSGDSEGVVSGGCSVWKRRLQNGRTGRFLRSAVVIIPCSMWTEVAMMLLLLLLLLLLDAVLVVLFLKVFYLYKLCVP